MRILKPCMIDELYWVHIPNVYDYSDTLENGIGCPYILMDFMEGINGQDAWFDRSISPSALEVRRERILCEVAAAMHALGRFTFKSAGAPDVDEYGNFNGHCRSMLVVDASASLRKMQGGENGD